MLINITIPKKLKPVLLLLGIGFSAYKIAIVIPNMLTISLGTWVNTIASITPGIIVVVLIVVWNPPQQISLSWRPKFPQIKTILPTRTMLLLLPFGILLGLITSWTIFHYELFNIIGQAIVFGSVIAMLIIGLIKPELGPAVFFILYTFLMFSEARVFAWGWLPDEIQNIPEWLETTLFRLCNIDITMLVFTMGFLVFLIRHVQQMGKTILDTPIMIFLIWTAVSVITANDPLEGLRSYLIRWVFPVVMYYATFWAMKRTNGVREIKLALVVLLFLSCLLTIQNAALSGFVSESGGERAMVVAVIARQMGPLIALILPLAVSILCDRRALTYVRCLSLLTIGLSFIMVVWEMQRTVILDVVLMIVLTFLLYPQRRKWYVILCAIVGLIIYGSFEKILMLVEFLRPALLRGNPLESSVNLDRLYLWEKALEITRDNPFLGIGPGGFRLLEIGLSTPEVSSHNIFLEVALESSIIVSVLFAIIYFSPIVKYFVIRIKGVCLKYDHDIRPWIISLSVYMFHLQFHTTWDWGYGLVVFCMLGVVVGTMRKTQSAESKAHSA